MRFIYFLLTFYLLVSPIRIYPDSSIPHLQMPDDTQSWMKIKEDIDENGFYFVEFTTDPSQEELVVFSFEKLEKRPSLDHDLKSILFHKEEISSLRKMKEERAKIAQSTSPHSIWRLVYVNNQDDIIYEYTIPPLGPFKEKYFLKRLIKKDKGFVSITYSTSKKDPVLFHIWSQWLMELNL